MINIDWPAKKLALKVHCLNYINDPLKRRTKAKGKWAIAFYCQKAHIVTDLEMSILILIAYLLALAHSILTERLLTVLYTRKRQIATFCTQDHMAA